MVVNFNHICVKNERKDEINKLKNKLNDIGITGVTYDEAIALLLEKDKRLIISAAAAAEKGSNFILDGGSNSEPSKNNWQY